MLAKRDCSVPRSLPFVTRGGEGLVESSLDSFTAETKSFLLLVFPTSGISSSRYPVRLAVCRAPSTPDFPDGPLSRLLSFSNKRLATNPCTRLYTHGYTLVTHPLISKTCQLPCKCSHVSIRGQKNRLAALAALAAPESSSLPCPPREVSIPQPSSKVQPSRGNHVYTPSIFHGHPAVACLPPSM